MNSELKSENSIEINAKPEQIWFALTDPEMVAAYFWDTKVKSTWIKGGEISYTGTYDDKEYVDKGIILEIELNKILKHTYWTSFSETEYNPDSSAIITYKITELDKNSVLTVTQDKFENEESRAKTENSWNHILHNIKNLIEKTK